MTTVPIQWMTWTVQGWLIAAQVLSTREFSELVLRKRSATLALWFSAIFIPGGLLADAIMLKLNVTVGLMAGVYVTAFVLRTYRREHIWYAVAFLLCNAAIEGTTWSTPRLFLTETLLVMLLILSTVVLQRLRNGVGLVVSYAAVLLAQLGDTVLTHSPAREVVVTGLTVLMTGLYAEFWVRRDRYQRERQHELEHDALTNALTRRGLEHWLVALRARGNQQGLILFCDVDNFKWINDTWGHDVGDAVLWQFCRRIESGLRWEDVLVRYGGDEFQVWIPVDDAGDGWAISERLHALVTSERYDVLPGLQLQVGVSMGWMFGSFDSTTAHRADRALLMAKASGKNCVRSAHEDHQDDLDRQISHRQAIHMERDPQLFWLSNIVDALWSDATYAFLLTDAAGRIIGASPAYLKLVGMSWADLSGQRPSILSAGKTPNRVYENMWQRLNAGKPWQGALLNRRPDGTEWWEVAQLFPVKFNGQVLGYWGLMQDLFSEGQFPRLVDPTDSGSYWQGEIDFVYQPIVDAAQHTIIGYEALARPMWGELPVSPDLFFRIAEKLHLGQQADWECLESLEQGLRRLGSWKGGKRLFVNVYSVTLRDTDRVRDWLARVRENLPEVTVVFEILETHVAPCTAEFLEYLRVQLPMAEWAQDDFGVGERDFIRALQCRPDWLKYDRQLVQDALRDPDVFALLREISGWARSRHTHIVFEGIETWEQSDFLRVHELGCEQGYFWSFPLPEPNLVFPSSRMEAQ